MSKRKQPNLLFLESSDSDSFTASGLSTYRDLRPFVIVREIIQNSLDAVQGTGINKATIRFSLRTIKASEIPGIKAYRAAFRKAIERRQDESHQGSLGDQEQMVIDRIQEALKRRQQNCLIVEDNGVGFNQLSMDHVLSDGTSYKGDGSGGAFGVGHLTVFPASDLRYVFYGGINSGKWIASGQAILASHYKNESDEIGRSANGYYLIGREKRKKIYPRKQALPSFLSNIMCSLREKSAHGSVIAVVAFNHFRETKTTLQQAVAEAAACNFLLPLLKRNWKLLLMVMGNSPIGHLITGISRGCFSHLGSKSRAKIFCQERRHMQHMTL